MIKFEKLYDMVILGYLINIDTLHKNGFSDEEIQYLIDTEKLVVSNGKYIFNDVDGLYNYGEKLAANFDYRKGKTCFKICLKLNSQHRNSILQKILQLLKGNNIEKALEYFDVLLSIEPEKYHSDNNLYAYLLSLLESVPSKYSDLVDLDELFDFYKETKTEEEHIENDIKRIITENRLTLAMKILNDMLAQNPTYNIRRIILKELLSKAIDNDKQIKNTIFELINQECYRDLIVYIESIRKRRYLTTNEYYILILAKAMIDLLNTKKLPLITTLHPKTLNEAIKGNNFTAAIILDQEFLKKKNKSEKNDALHILLKKICDLLNQMQLEETMINVNQEELLSQEGSCQLAPVTETGETFTELASESKNLNDILYFMKENMIPYERIIEQFALTPEEALKLKLLMAKDCYSLGFVNIGDRYFKEVSEDPNITEGIADMIQDIETNKQVIINGLSRKREQNN